MRLLIVSHLFRNPLEHSKLPHLFDLTQVLARDIDVDVVSPVPWFPPLRIPRSWHLLSQIPGEHAYGKVRVRYPRYFILPFRLLYFLAGRSFLRALRRSVAGSRYDLAWAHYAYPDGWATVRLGKAFGLPTVVTVRGEDVRKDVRHAGIRGKVSWALREATAVSSPHPETTELARGLGRVNIVDLHNGIDVDRFATGNGGRIREELGLTDEFAVGFIGHLVAAKDPAALLEAIALIPGEERVVAILAGSPGRGRRQADLPALAARLGIEKRVFFLGDRGDVPDVLAACQVFAQIDVIENIWSNSMLEAMAAGLPCIVTRSGTTERHLRHRDDAWLIPSRSPRDLADAIVALKADGSLRARLGARGRERVAAEFDLRAVSARALDLCRAVASGESGPAGR